MPTPDTVASLLADLLRREPGRPLVTFYDQQDGAGPEERVELSVTTYGNWVAKAASLLVDELDLGRGARILLDLPPHWLGTVFLGAAWTAGLIVVDGTGPAPDAVVCGPDGLASWAPRADDLTVLACSLLPLGVRFADGVPAGVHDVGVEIWSQPDAFTPWDPPTGDDAALERGDAELTQRDLLRSAAAGSALTDGGRLFTTENPASPPWSSVFTEPLVRSGSLVLVSRPDRSRLEATYAAERATARLP